MKLLIQKGLMFANLFEVATPALVERYNRALEKLTGRRTGLESFHIDISGYAPEIGDEFGDHRYLNPRGVNRQFILLSTAQKTAPLLDAQFSTSRDILRGFIEANEDQLFALCARDAVAGELANSVFDLTEPAQLLNMKAITVEADTTGAHLATAAELAGLVARFRSEEDAWADEALIARMIALARQTGDLAQAPVSFARTRFEQGNFWTAHFGGVYVFARTARPALIASGPRGALGERPVDTVLDLRQRARVAAFLGEHGLVAPIARPGSTRAAAILRQKIDYVLVDTASTLGEDVATADRHALRAAARRHADWLPAEFHALETLLAWVEGRGPEPEIAPDHPAYFYTLRSSAHPDRDLVNMLLSELSPLDIRQLFICHKQAFYAAWRGWSAAKQSFVAEHLAREYLIDKAGARETLFGPEPPMDEPAGTDDMIARVGPWGAVTRAAQRPRGPWGKKSGRRA